MRIFFAGRPGQRLRPARPDGRHVDQSVKDYELNISDEDFELLKKWIVRNCDTLTDYWNSKIDTEECISKLKKI